MESFGKVPFPYNSGGKEVPVASATAPTNWSKRAWRTEEYQSWDRPFRLDVEMTSRADGSGPRLTADTGEAFSYFDLADMASTMNVPSSPFSNPFGGMMGLGFPGGFGLPGGFGMPSAPSYPLPSGMKVPKPHTGRPERPFESLPKYLDGLIIALDNGFLARNQIWLLGETIVGETADSMLSRERELAAYEDKRWREAGITGLDFRVNSVIDRTMARHWKIVDAGGELTHIIIGAKVHGVDKLCFKSGAAPASMLGCAPFGRALRGNATYYDAEWIIEKRFYGIMVEGDRDIDWFRDAVIKFGDTIEFDKSLMGQMNKEYKRLSEADLAASRKANEEFHRYNQELGRRMEQRDLERQERMRQHEAQMQADRARRQAWDKQMESDRRVRDAWSEALRGTEKYRDPYGHMVEMPVTAPNQRAFYDHRSGKTVMSDVSDLDKPSDWEELPRW